MAGIRTWGPRKRRMEGIDKSTELSWTPIFFKNCFLLTKNIPRWHLADATKVTKLIGIVGSIPNPKPLGSDTNMWPVNQTQPLPSQRLAIGALGMEILYLRQYITAISYQVSQQWLVF